MMGERDTRGPWYGCIYSYFLEGRYIVMKICKTFGCLFTIRLLYLINPKKYSLQYNIRKTGN